MWLIFPNTYLIWGLHIHTPRTALQIKPYCMTYWIESVESTIPSVHHVHHQSIYCFIYDPVLSMYCILCTLYFLYPVLSVSCTLCILYSLYPVFSVSCILFILYSLCPVLSVSSILCILNSLCPVSSVPGFSVSCNIPLIILCVWFQKKSLNEFIQTFPISLICQSNFNIES